MEYVKYRKSMNGLMGDWEANDLRWWSDKDVVYSKVGRGIPELEGE
jgi:hypothetical protein